MAATDKPYRNQKTLDIVFAVSCILMLVSIVWMLVADYNREYKNGPDAPSATWNRSLDERQMLAQLPDPAEVETPQKDGRGQATRRWTRPRKASMPRTSA